MASLEHSEDLLYSLQCERFVACAPNARACGVTMICVSDTHDFQHVMKCKIPRADILVHAGDFSVRGSREEIENFKHWIADLLSSGTVKHAVVVAGNHELSFQEGRSKHPQVVKNQTALKRSLLELPNVNYLEDSLLHLCGLTFYGSPWTTPVGGKCEWAFQLRDTSDAIGQKWASIPEGLDVLVTHQPPFGQGDEPTERSNVGSSHKRRATHVGSRTLLDRVVQVNPAVHIFGHYHEGHGISRHKSLRTLFVNAAICNEDYHPDHPPILVEFQGDNAEAFKST